jgi:uncharacterized membrane protein YfcA
VTIETIVAFAAVVLLAYTVQTVTGFGSTVVCVTLGASLMPIDEVVAFAVPLSFLQTTYIVVRHDAGIRWKLLLGRVLPAMGGGMVIGFGLSRAFDGGAWPQIVFAVLVLILSARELWLLYRAAPTRPMPLAASIATMLGAGAVHGVYGTGGPMLVYAVGRLGLDKKQLRSTLSMVWLVLDAVLTSAMAFEGRYHEDRIGTFVFLIPMLPLGIVIGELVHKRVDERRFRIGLFVMLALAAIVLVARAAR